MLTRSSEVGIRICLILFQNSTEIIAQMVNTINKSLTIKRTECGRSPTDKRLQRTLETYKMHGKVWKMK